MEPGNKNIESSRLLHGWILFAVSALIVAGLFAFLVAMARTPLVQNLFTSTDYVRVALVGHVDLSFVIWFLAFEGALWTLASTDFLKQRTYSPALGWAGLSVSVAGTLMITVCSVLGLGKPLFINYIPVIDHPLFYTGLVVLFAGIFITLVNNFLTIKSVRVTTGRLGGLLAFGAGTSAVAVLVAIVCLALSLRSEYALNGAGYMDLEALYWGGGHILQFANTVAMVCVWLYLTGAVYKTFSIKASYGKFLFGIYLVFILAAPFTYLFYDTLDMGYRETFTRIMQFGLGPSTTLFGLAILAAVLAGPASEGAGQGRFPWKSPEFSSLVMSMMLFLMGGLISFTIGGYNTKIPSHYHGAIGGVTMAFMGMTYNLAPSLGRQLYSRRMASLQPYVYGIGQALFVLGMFGAGSHGVARKTFGAAQQLDDPVKLISMIVFGIGGLVAIIGGIMFIVNVGASFLGRAEARERVPAHEAKQTDGGRA